MSSTKSDATGRVMKNPRIVATPEDRAIQGKPAVCALCGRSTRGLWREVKGQRVRLPTRHKESDTEYWVGSNRPALIGD